MKQTIIKTTSEVEVRLEELPDGHKHIYKEYANHAGINDEWDALVYLHGKGYSVPKPIRRSKNGMYIQYIENGTLWDFYKNADATAQKTLLTQFTKLLHDLHILDTAENQPPPQESFIQTETAEIHRLIEKNQLGDNYTKALERLKSAKTEAQPLCYIHRDYHPWNVLRGKNEKLYITDFALNQGDFRFDVAWTYMLMSRTGFPQFAENFLREYANLQPKVLADFEFFKQLANLRWLVNVQPQTDKFMLHMIKIAEQEMENFK